jgi:hypothetical protein
MREGSRDAVGYRKLYHRAEDHCGRTSKLYESRPACRSPDQGEIHTYTMQLKEASTAIATLDGGPCP